MEHTHKPDGCECPQHKAPTAVRPYTLSSKGHVDLAKHHFPNGFDHFSEEEYCFMMDIARAAVAKPEPEPVAKAEGVPVNDVLKLMAGFTEALKSLNINVSPRVVADVKLPATRKTTLVHRDERGRMESAETQESPIE